MTKVKNVNFVQFGEYCCCVIVIVAIIIILIINIIILTATVGKHRMECWYYSPFPPEYFLQSKVIDCLYFDEFTLRFFRTPDEVS